LAIAALRFILSQPAVVTVTPTFRTTAEIEAYAVAGDGELLSRAQLDRIAAGYDHNFGVEPLVGAAVSGS
jgi:aryl-alcohol dehydrogenase-like predicted oxidoreductase